MKYFYFFYENLSITLKLSDNYLIHILMFYLAHLV